MKSKDWLEIAPERFYRPSYVVDQLGRRCVENLRGAGLRAIGGWYLGKTILECFERAWQLKSSQRVPSKKGEENYGNTKKEKVAKSSKNGAVQLVSKRIGAPSIRSQLEEVERNLRQAAH